MIRSVFLAGVAALSISAAHAEVTLSRAVPDAACYSPTPPTGQAYYALKCDLTGTTEFQQGYADREAWEQWFNAQVGEYQAGAKFWSGERSLANPTPCATLGGDASMGCFAAKARLDVSDQRRRLSPAYKQGWNSYTAPQVATAAPRTPAPAAAPETRATPVDPIECSELAKMAHKPGCSAPNPALQRLVAPFFPSLTPQAPSAPVSTRPATADMPNYDVPAYCKANAAISFQTPQECMDAEFLARSSARYKWNAVPVAARMECVRAASETGSYSTLFLCVMGYTGL
jgi:hypothetical protein